jgi:hypothetical protein
MNNQPDSAAAVGILAFIFAAIGAVVLISLIINAIVCYFVSSWLKKVPAQHRKMEPGLVWLLMIPCFPIIWNFFVFQRIPDSFKSYFDSVGRTDVGDCGKGIGLGYAICAACSVIPFLNYVAGPATLVLLIINLVKMNELKNKIV